MARDRGTGDDGSNGSLRVRRRRHGVVDDERTRKRPASFTKQAPAKNLLWTVTCPRHRSDAHERDRFDLSILLNPTEALYRVMKRSRFVRL